MKKHFEVEVFDENEFFVEMQENSEIKICMPSNTLVEITANKEGLLSLGKMLISYAESNIGDSDYFHCETKISERWNGHLEKDSLELSVVLKKTT